MSKGMKKRVCNVINLKSLPCKMYALVEDGVLCHYYSLAHVYFRKNDALCNMKYYNSKPFNHKMKIEEVLIKSISKRGKG